jgi:hypothetical protein
MLSATFMLSATLLSILLQDAIGLRWAQCPRAQRMN